MVGYEKDGDGDGDGDCDGGGGGGRGDDDYDDDDDDNDNNGDNNRIPIFFSDCTAWKSIGFCEQYMDSTKRGCNFDQLFNMK